MTDLNFRMTELILVGSGETYIVIYGHIYHDSLSQITRLPNENSQDANKNTSMLRYQICRLFFNAKTLT